MLEALPLRIRVTLLYILLGLVMSLLFAATVTFIAEDYEHVLVDEIMHSQAEDYAARLRDEPDTMLPRSSRLSGYIRRKDGSGDVPDALAALPPGIHESERDDEEGLHMAVFDTQVGRLYFTLDLQDIERLELHMDWILIAVVVLGTLVSAWLGWLLSGSVVRPVRRLADAVDGLSTSPTRTALAADLPRDELGRLGQAIDDYQARLVAAEDAERAFFADASHELRTPIAVVRGATELLLEDSVDVPAWQPRLQRLDRGMRQLSELLDALLGVARRRVGASETVNLRDWIAHCLGTFDAIRDGSLHLAIDGDPGACRLPTREAELVLLGIVRRLLPPETRGTLRVELGHAVISLQCADTDTAVATTAMPATITTSDRGLGMTLIGRLAAQIGWTIDEDAGQRRVRIGLPCEAVVEDSPPTA